MTQRANQFDKKTNKPNVQTIHLVQSHPVSPSLALRFAQNLLVPPNLVAVDRIATWIDQERNLIKNKMSKNKNDELRPGERDI